MNSRWYCLCLNESCTDKIYYYIIMIVYDMSPITVVESVIYWIIIQKGVRWKRTLNEITILTGSLYFVIWKGKKCIL